MTLRLLLLADTPFRRHCLLPPLMLLLFAFSLLPFSLDAILML